MNNKINEWGDSNLFEKIKDLNSQEVTQEELAKQIWEILPFEIKKLISEQVKNEEEKREQEKLDMEKAEYLSEEIKERGEYPIYDEFLSSFEKSWDSQLWKFRWIDFYRDEYSLWEWTYKSLDEFSGSFLRDECMTSNDMIKNRQISISIDPSCEVNDSWFYNFEWLEKIRQDWDYLEITFEEWCENLSSFLDKIDKHIYNEYKNINTRSKEWTLELQKPTQKFKMINEWEKKESEYDVTHAEIMECDHKVWDHEVDDSSVSSTVILDIIMSWTEHNKEEYIGHLMSEYTTEEWYSESEILVHDKVARQTIENMIEKGYIIEEWQDIIINIEPNFPNRR